MACKARRDRMRLGQQADSAIESAAADILNQKVLQFELICNRIRGNVRRSASSGVVMTISPNPCATPAFK